MPWRGEVRGGGENLRRGEERRAEERESKQEVVACMIIRKTRKRREERSASPVRARIRARQAQFCGRGRQYSRLGEEHTERNLHFRL